MADIYGSWVTNGSGSSQRSWRAWMNYSTSSSNTQTTFTASCRLDLDGGSGTTAKYLSNAITAKLYIDGAVVKTFTNPSAVTVHGDTNWTMLSHSVTWNRATSAKSHSAYWTITSAKGSWGGTSTTGSVSISVPALASYTVSYNANGGTGTVASQVKYYNTTLTLRSNSFTRSGYTFVGWGTSSSATTASYQPGGSYTGNAALTLYAIWKKTITLSYNANGGSGAPGSSSATVYNSTTSYKFTLSGTRPTRSGYDFLGWSTSSGATAASYQPGGTITISSSTTLYAVWKRKPVYVKVNGTWKSGYIYVKVNGTWREAKAISVKANGTWHTI